MTPADLELVPTADLLAELLRRATSRLVVAYQCAEYREGDPRTPDPDSATGWRWEARNCDAGSVFRQLAELVPPTEE